MNYYLCLVSQLNLYIALLSFYTMCLNAKLNHEPRVKFWLARVLSAGSYHSTPLLAPCVFSVLEQIKCCVLPCQQILQTLMCRWTHKHAQKHTLVHISGMHSGILIFRRVNAHVPCKGFTLFYYIKTFSSSLSHTNHGIMHPCHPTQL